MIKQLSIFRYFALRRKSENFYLSPVFNRLFGPAQQSIGNVLGEVVFPAIATDFRRHLLKNNGALAKLQSHRWRGNVRELENTLHRAVLLADGTDIGPEAIELADSGTAAAFDALKESGINSLVGRRMEDVERDLIIETLSHTLGNRTHAAIILGISIRALRNKLRDYASHGVAVPPPGAGIAA